MQEIWKDIDNFENIYQISNLGRIKNLKFNRILKSVLSKHPKPYPTIGLYKKNARKYTNLHVLIAKAFIPNPHNKPFVNHIDGDKTNNKLENLEWVTCKENIDHAYAIGLCDNIPERRMLAAIKRLNNNHNFQSIDDMINYLEKIVNKKGTQ